MKVAVAGASGFIGSALVPFLLKQGHEVICLVRTPRSGCVYWNPEAHHIDLSKLSGVDAVINLCGESIVGRWNQEKMERIRESRFISTEFLVDSILKLDLLPKLFISASAIGYYGDRGKEVLTEKSQSGHGYLSQICRTWESMGQKLQERGIRVVHPRFGVVLGEGGGALAKMVKPFKLGFGGRMGSGEQIMSWIALDDLLNGIHHIMSKEELKGPVNFVAPESISNRAFTSLLGKLLHRPTFFPLPKPILTLLFGSGSEVFLASATVRPEVLIRTGFTFSYPVLEEALKKYLRIKS